VVIAFVLLLALHAARPLIATMTAVIVVLLLATLITRFWKISLHLVGVTGAVTAYTLLFGPLFLVLSPLVVCVGWARWRVGAHTPWQAVAGTVLAGSLTVVIFWLWHVLP
jgi:membrane-associated phospholipid phosphatase